MKKGNHGHKERRARRAEKKKRSKETLAQQTDKLLFYKTVVAAVTKRNGGLVIDGKEFQALQGILTSHRLEGGGVEFVYQEAPPP